MLRIGSDGSFGFGHAASLSASNPSTNSSSLPEENVQKASSPSTYSQPSTLADTTPTGHKRDTHPS